MLMILISMMRYWSTLTSMGSYSSAKKKLYLEMMNRETLLAKHSTEDPPILSLNLSYPTFAIPSWDSKIIFLVIQAAYLVIFQVEALVLVLKKFKRVISWFISYIISIPSRICTYKIKLEPDCVPNIEYHSWLNFLCKRYSRRRSSSGLM